MVFKRLREMRKNMNDSNDEKYEILYYKYSQLKMENKKLQEGSNDKARETKDKIITKVSEMLLNLEDDVSEMKNSSFKVNATSKEVQKLLVDINKTQNTLNKILEKLNIEPIIPSERYYDPELHEVSSYTAAKAMEKGIILKTLKKGWKYKNQVIKKPKVVVTN